VIIAIVIFELIACFCLTVLIGIGNEGSGLFIAPLEVWFGCAVLQLSIHYLPRGPYIRYGLLSAVMLMLLAGVTLQGEPIVPYLHQALLITGVAALPQFWWERLSQQTKGRSFVLGLIVFLSLPLGFAAWVFGNIPIVKIKAWLVSRGDSYCILLSEGHFRFSGPYHKASNDWSLNGCNMFRSRGSGGSGDCCQWDFHALLLTRNNELFNWSYNYQHFEKVSEQTRRMMDLDNLTCR